MPAFKRKNVRTVAIGLISSLTVALNTLLNHLLFLTSTSPEFLSPAPASVISSTFDLKPEPVMVANECQISNAFTSEVKYWEKDICRWSTKHDLDPDLIATIMQIESCGNRYAVSSTGVKGLFQVTGANLKGRDGYDPDASAAAGPGEVLKNSLTAAGGNVRAAMAGYNGGSWARQYVEGEISQNRFIQLLRSHRLWRTSSKALAKLNEVEWYARWANIYFEAKENRQDTLNLWLNKGGYRLCNEAAVAQGYTPRFSKPTPESPIYASDTINKNQ